MLLIQIELTCIFINSNFIYDLVCCVAFVYTCLSLLFKKIYLSNKRTYEISSFYVWYYLKLITVTLNEEELDIYPLLPHFPNPLQKKVLIYI